MTTLVGTNVMQPIVPVDSNDTYPTHLEEYGYGGYRSVTTYADLATIPTDRLAPGMLVGTLDSTPPLLYQLGTDLVTWTEVVVSATEAQGYAQDAQNWATQLGSQVDSIDWSAKEYAIGTDIRGSIGSAKDWATYLGGTVNGSTYSAAYYAALVATQVAGATASASAAAASASIATTQVGLATTQAINSAASAVTSGNAAGTATTAATNAAIYEAGAQTAASAALTSQDTAEAWAVQLGSQVSSTDWSSKEYAIGTDILGTIGSSKSWATYTDSTVDGTNYSAKYWGLQASTYSSNATTQAGNAATSATNAAGSASTASTEATASYNSAALAQEWATQQGSEVASTDWSAKEYAIGPDLQGTVGSAKDWAIGVGAIDSLGNLSSQAYSEMVTAAAARDVDTHINLLDYIPSTNWTAIRAGTSTYDCTADINLAITDAQAVGKALYCPAGLYQYSGLITVPSDITIFGDCSITDDADPNYGLQTFFQSTTASAYWRVGVANATGTTASRHITLKFFCLDCNNQVNFGFMTGFVNRVEFYFLHVRNALDSGYMFSATQNSIFRRLNTMQCPRSISIANGAQNNTFYDFVSEGATSGSVVTGNGYGLGQFGAQYAYNWRNIRITNRTDTDFFDNDSSSTLQCTGNNFFGGIHDYGQGCYTVEIDNPGSITTFINYTFTGIAALPAGEGYIDGGGGQQPDPASMYIGNGATVYWDGAISTSNAAPGSIIENHGTLIVGKVYGIGNNTPGWLMANIRNYGTVQWGHLNATEPMNMIRPENSFAGNNQLWYGGIQDTNVTDATGSSSTVTLNANNTWSVSTTTVGDGNGIYFPFDTAYAYSIAQGTVHKIRLYIQSVTGGTVDINEVYHGQPSGDPSVINIISDVGAGVYELVCNPTYYSGVNYMVGISVTSSTSTGATSWVMGYCTVQNIGRAGA